MSEVSNMRLALVLIALLLASCATPVAPTGGEPDRSGPKLLSSQPENATVNYRERIVRFTFEDYVDRNSFRQALRIEPNISVPFEVSWRRKTATINLLEPLPENTTVIFTVGNELRDTRGNRVKSPISVALSTGPDIDGGTAKIRLLPLRPGISTENVSILLYREPFDLTEPALYVGQPDTAGIVIFSYLRQGDYSAIAVNDINRNRRYDPPREFAQPAIRSQFVLDEEELDMGTIYYARADTIRTVLEGVGLLSSNRLRLRFSQELNYEMNQSITITDVAGETSIQASLLYLDDNDKSIAYFHTAESLEETNEYSISLAGFRDKQGRSIRSQIEFFEGSSEPDTTFVRFKRHLTEEGVRGRQPFQIMYTGVLEGTDISDSLQVFRNREADSRSVTVETNQNILSIIPVSAWNESDSYEIKAWDPALQRHIDITTRIIREADMGELQLVISDSTHWNTPMVAEIYSNRGQLLRKQNFNKEVLIEDIVAGSYQLLVFADIDGAGVWDYGTVNPYSPPAPIYVNRSVPVRSRMTADLLIEFNP